VSEIVPENKKGQYGVVFQITLTLGILLSYIIGYVFSKEIEGRSLQWRLMLGTFGTILPLFLLPLIIFFMKETSNMSQNEATPLQNKDYYEPISPTGGWLGLFVPKRFIKQTLTGIVLAITLQLTGVNAIIYFGTSIISKAFPGSDPILLNIAIGAWNFVTTLISLALVSRLSRRILMTGATIVISIALLVVGFCFKFITDQTQIGIGVGVGLALFLAGFEAGPGCLFWILANEMFDKNVLAEGAALVNVLQWAFNLIISTLFLLMFGSALGEAGTFFIFGGIGFFCAAYLFLFLRLPTERVT